MSKPLTPDDLRILREIDNETGHPDCIDAALARLDFLERKVQAAERLAENARDAVVICWRDLRHGPLTVAIRAYDEVQP